MYNFLKKNLLENESLLWFCHLSLPLKSDLQHSWWWDPPPNNYGLTSCSPRSWNIYIYIYIGCEYIWSAFSFDPIVSSVLFSNSRREYYIILFSNVDELIILVILHIKTLGGLKSVSNFLAQIIINYMLY